MPQSAPLAKLSPPRLSSILHRTRRYGCIDLACRGGALWIEGPPGAGKTVLVGGYCQDRKRPVIWYRIDDGDADPAAFFHYLSLAAAHGGHPDVDSLPKPCGECFGAIRPFARQYFRQLFSGLPPETLLVFDDCHVLDDDAPVHAVLSTAIDELLPEQGVVFLARKRPPGVFSPRLLSESLRGLSWHDLRLDEEEMTDICRLRLGSDKPSRIIRDICVASQGWVAGLVLMLEQYRSGNYCPTTQIDGNQTYLDLFNYFAAEVFASLPIERQGFLMRTALFPSLKGEMAETLTGHADADQVLEILAQGNFFTTRRVRDNTEYEYHPLFRTFLLSRLEQTVHGMALQQLRRRAADILVAHHHWHEAAELYCQATDWESLAALCEQRAPHLLEIGSTLALLRHLQRIPETVLENKPWLLLYYGAAAIHSDIALAREKYEQSHAGFRARGEHNGAALAWCGIVETYVYQWGDFSPLDGWIDACADFVADETFAQLPTTTRSRLTVAMFTALMYRQPWHADLPRWADRIETIVDHGVDTRLCMKTGMHLLMYHAWWSGDLPKARCLVERLRRRAAEAVIDPLTQIIWHAIEAAYAWMVGEQGKALSNMHAGLAIADRNRLHHFDFMLCAQGAWAHLTREELAQAETLLDRMQAMIRPGRILDACHYYYLRSMAFFQHRNAALMQEYAEKALEHARQASCPWAEGIMETAVGRAWHLLDDAGQARKHQYRALELAKRHRSGITERGALLALAELELAIGEEADGLDFLRRAFHWCARHQATNWAAWRNDTVAWLCGWALQEGIEADFARYLIRERGLCPPESFRTLQEWPWPVRIHTLGRFAIVIEEQVLTVRGKAQGKPLELLKLLIALGGRGVAQGALADLLWPDADGDAARRTFDSTLHRLRKLLSVDDVLRLQDGKLTLDTARCWVDAWAFDMQARRLCDQLKRVPAEPVPLRMASHVLALYQGRFLHNENLHGIDERADRYETRYLRLSLDLGRTLEASDRNEEALDVYRQALEHLPLEERLYHALIRLLVALNRRTEALRLYHQCERRLGEASGLRPPGSLTALVESLAIH